MNIVLINPYSDSPYPVMPLGLAYIAAVLEQNHIGVSVIDAWAERMRPEQVAEALKELKPDLIGITISSPVAPVAFEIAAAAKNVTHVPVVIGGPHASALPEECLQNHSIDFVVMGEGETTIIQLIKHLSTGSLERSAIKGIAYRKNGKVIINESAELIADLNQLPMPARHLFPVNKYRTHLPYGRKTPYMTMISSRGCPYHCYYCSKAVFGDKYRALSPKNVVRELKHIIKVYGIKEFRFYDDDFTLNMKRAAEICDEIVREKIKIDWSCTTRVDLVNDELLSKMKKAGCYMISYGVESGDALILERAEKGYTLEDVETAFRLTKKYKIKILAFFMLGLPGENETTIEKTIQLALKLDPDFISWAIMSIIPGSRMYHDFSKGLLKKTLHSHIEHPFAVSQNYHFYEESFPFKTLAQYSIDAHKRFYLRPQYLVRQLFCMRSWYEFKGYAALGYDFIKYIIVSKLRKSDETVQSDK
jgi:radical SAM superfamily enzyme YgiQ (UPF0313 family)